MLSLTQPAVREMIFFMDRSSTKFAPLWEVLLDPGGVPASLATAQHLKKNELKAEHGLSIGHD